MHIDTPFRGSVAVGSGLLTRHRLNSDFERIFRDVYISKGSNVDAVVKARASHIFAGNEAVSCGLSAAALHGAKWIDPGEPAELIWPTRGKQLDGIRVRYDTLSDSEIGAVGGLAVTTVPRTMFDLARHLPRLRAVQMLDALSNATGVRVDQVHDVVNRHSGRRGVRGVPSILGLVDGGAESPQETRTRLLLVDSGLPRPETQIRIADDRGRVFARCDLGWRRWRVAVEYEGIQHWTSEKQRTWDIERFDMFEQYRWTFVRVNSEQLRTRPDDVVARVRQKLRAAGAPV